MLISWGLNAHESGGLVGGLTFDFGGGYSPL